MKLATPVCAAVLLACASTAFAQPSGKPRATKPTPAVEARWNLEPRTVFGVTLGAALPLTSFPACEPPSQANGYSEPRAPCIEPPAHGFPLAKLKGLGIKGVADMATLHLVDDLVSAVHVTFRQQDFSTMLQILVERYGEPQHSETQSVVSRAGANLDSQVLRWTGAENSLTLIERSGRVDQSVAAFSNRGTQELERARKSQSATDSAKKF